MTKLLDRAIEKVRQLPDSTQDEIAEFLLVLAARASGPILLDDDTRSAVREGLLQARRGEFASDQPIDIFGRMAGTIKICGDIIGPIDLEWEGDAENI